MADTAKILSPEKIVVLPECAVHGYMDPGRWAIWTDNDQLSPATGTQSSNE